ncbi:sulfurtransferase [Piscirickettsia salmonis]|uniref:Thiosulfate sulfurtransferase PspE n=1 Tax=Piscirickettsia salmonis TaxID=1238 RepID=A0A9Q6LKB9_PISSA|nr:rhodanese-like domain-containing protein [Piscirickettsia salmonis]RNC77996.1 sulfurtransferase [Piscirickettsiaceae bacterium NZ-RLO2]ALA24489.1 rhodanese-like domain protein [Piscirickettsia salmonis]APS44844.1 sulfurtransferase [Piscirickettsia salmonis]APS48205.1 sulfurtransferase [Piscirickettsia salmonis]APS49474.1 sulfurtransferase [Piscirickettsia salmonis]
MKHSSAFLTLVEQARSSVSEISIENVCDYINEHVDFQLIDVRESDEVSVGKIKGARVLSKGIIERDIERLIPDVNTHIVLYCGGGYRSALAAENLQRMGYLHVESMIGGFKAWQQAHYETESTG